MTEEQRDVVSQMVGSKSLRPVLIASKQTVRNYSTFLHHLLVGLADESIRVALICPPDCDVESFVPPSVEVIRDPAFKLPLLWRQSRRVLIEKLEKFKPTMLHCLCESKTWFVRGLSRQLNLPYVLTVNSLKKRWERFGISSRRCMKIITPTESIAANVREIHPRFNERIEQVNDGVFVEDTTNCFSNPFQLASMLTVVRPNDDGQFGNLLGAVRHLAIEGYEFMLVVISEGRMESQMRKLLSGLGLSQIITIVPKLEPRRSMLAAGDIFIRAIPTKAFDPLLLEAMSVGAAVAGCRGGVDDLIIEGQTAVVFDPGDELSIYSALQRLLDGRDSARQLAKNAQQYLKKNHSVSGMIESILRIYRQGQESFES